MSRGLSRIQREIVRVLAVPRACLTTPELADQLIEAAVINGDAPIREWWFTTRRACRSLERRGLVVSITYPRTKAISWELTALGWESARQEKT